LLSDANANYFAEVVIDLDLVEEPMIADQMLIMQMFLRDTHDTIRPLSFLRR
jgi:aconitate hydratase 2/2-methylisocitrate dehydratase